MNERRPLVERSRRFEDTERGEIQEILRESEEIVRDFLDELYADRSLPNRRRPAQRRVPNDHARTPDEAPV